MQEVQRHINVPAAVTAAAFAGRNVATAGTTGALPRARTPGINAITTNAPSVLPAANITLSARCSWPSSGHQRLPQ